MTGTDGDKAPVWLNAAQIDAGLGQGHRLRAGVHGLTQLVRVAGQLAGEPQGIGKTVEERRLVAGIGRRRRSAPSHR